MHRLQTEVALPEQQLGVPGPADLVLCQAPRVSHPADDVPLLPVEGEHGVGALEADVPSIPRRCGYPGRLVLELRSGQRKRDTGFRLVPGLDA